MLNCSDKGSCFFDRDFDPSKSLLHVLAWHLPRISPARPCGQDCFFPLMTHLDDGEVDLASHVLVPAVILQSHAPSDHLSDCGTCGARLISKVFRLLGEMIAPEVVVIRWVMSLRCPSTWCGLPPGMVRSQLLDESQIHRLSAGSGTEARHAQRLMKIDENCPCCSISGLSSRRQAPVESEFLPEICNPTPDANSGVFAKTYDELHESLEDGTRLRPARWQRGGQRNQRRKRALLVPKFARAISGRRHHRLRNPVDHRMSRWKVGRVADAKRCKGTLGTAESSDRSWQVPQVCDGARVRPGRKRQSLRCPSRVSERLHCPGSSTSPWFTASCCRDGSLAIIQPM